MEIQFKTSVLDGKRIAYTDRTVFIVEVGRGPKGAYRTHYSFTGNLAQAVVHFNGINIGNGYKKRLRAPSLNKPVLARAAS